MINFNILDGSVKYKTEKSQNQAEKQALDLVTNDTFFVTINKQAIKLRKINTKRLAYVSLFSYL